MAESRELFWRTKKRVDDVVCKYTTKQMVPYIWVFPLLFCPRKAGYTPKSETREREDRPKSQGNIKWIGG